MTAGEPRPHESARGHVTGQARYTGDLDAPGRLLHAWPVQAPQARARVVALDSRPALALPGVVAVLTAADVPGANDSGPVRHDEPLFPAEVCYHGQAVAWVLGESERVARGAAAHVGVDYEPLPAILTLDEAIAAESFHTDPHVIRRGDPEAVIATAQRTVEGELRSGAQDHFALETHVSLALLDEEGQVLVHSSTQHPSETQAVVAHVLGVARNRVVVQSLRMGGAFGGKETQANPWAAVAALGAWKTGRPVRVRLDRDRDMILTGKRHPFLARYRAACSAAGELLAVDVEIYADGGWSLDLSEAILNRAVFHVDNAYYVPHLQVRGRVARTNKTSQTAFRGFGGPQGMLVIEEIMDRVARAAGLPPETVRQRNLYRGEGETNTTHYGQPLGDNRIQTIWHDVTRSSDLAARRSEIAAANSASRHTRRGLAITPVKFGISFTTTFLNQAGALVLIYHDGSVQVNHGGTEMGQGLQTKILQVAATALGIPESSIRMMPTRTDKVPNTSATAASSGADLNGAAVQDACTTLKLRLAPVAAELLVGRGVTRAVAADLHFAAGRVFSPLSPAEAVTFAEVVQRAYLARIQLSATGYYRTPGIYFDPERARGHPFHYFAYGAAVSEVEVDGLTGEYRLLRADILHDAGASLNPLVDRGQIGGGFIQGMGWLTMEEVLWDTDGRLLTHAPSTYKIPTIADLPPDLRIELLARAPQDGVVYGSKAVGEPPLMLALSVREAIRDAVAAFAPPGVVLEACPLAAPATPEAVLRAVQQAQSGSRSTGTAYTNTNGLPRHAQVETGAASEAGARGDAIVPPTADPHVRLGGV